MLFDLVIKYGPYKHVDEQDHSNISNDPAHHSLFSCYRVIRMRVLNILQKNFLTLPFIFLSFLIILHRFSLEMLYDLYETSFERSLNAIEDMHMDNVIFVECDIMLAKCFVWEQVL